jgi:cobalt-zinc-cadmium efflux system membrane fusion protein
MRPARYMQALAGLAVVAALGAGAVLTRDWWAQAPPEEPVEAEHGHGDETVVKLSPQAWQNLGLHARPVQVQSYWREVQVPGMVVDRPGVSDRGVVAPAVAVVARVHAFPGDTVRPGARLFTLRLISEYLQNAQSELFKATREIELVREKRERLKDVAQSGLVPPTQLIELDNQQRRLGAAVQAYRQDLLTRGLTPAHLEAIAAGKFVAEIEVVAPPPPSSARPLPVSVAGGDSAEPAFEVQELKVELGQQVQAGQLLCLLANHRELYVEGHAFRREAPLLEAAAQQGWPVRVEFNADDGADWPPLSQDFRIRHLSNMVNPATRTFSFYLPLNNQARSYDRDGKTYLAWRYRPGQRVRLHVPVEELQDVIVLPAEALVREGADAYVFRQNGTLLERRPVHVVYEDRRHVVLAADGSVMPGNFVAQGSAASLNRILKAQAQGDEPHGHHHHDH